MKKRECSQEEASVGKFTQRQGKDSPWRSSSLSSGGWGWTALSHRPSCLHVMEKTGACNGTLGLHTFMQMRHNNHAQRRANCLSPCPRLPSRVVIHRLACSSGHPGSLLEYRLLGPVHKVSDSGVGPIICISKQFPDDVDDTSLGTIL